VEGAWLYFRLAFILTPPSKSLFNGGLEPISPKTTKTPHSKALKWSFGGVDKFLR